jgi:hypothetical protein
MLACTQCDKPAIRKIHGHPLCLDCSYKVEMMEYMRFAKLASQQNALLDYADAITGVSGGFGRMHIPPPPRPLQNGPTVFNNIRVENSTVGVINTGEVQSIDSVVSSARTAGDEQLAAALKNFASSGKFVGDLTGQPGSWLRKR